MLEETTIDTRGMTLNQAIQRMAKIQFKGRGACGIGASFGKHKIHVYSLSNFYSQN